MPATHHTDWMPFEHYGYSAYRIWVQTDGRSWWQRHEWRRADGEEKLDDWIPSFEPTAAWIAKAHPVQEAA